MAVEQWQLPRTSWYDVDSSRNQRWAGGELQYNRPIRSLNPSRNLDRICPLNCLKRACLRRYFLSESGGSWYYCLTPIKIYGSCHILDAAGKALERIIYSRLFPAIRNQTGLSDWKYGFRNARSTTDSIILIAGLFENENKYCMLVTLDVKYFFNSHRHTYSKKALMWHRWLTSGLVFGSNGVKCLLQSST